MTCAAIPTRTVPAENARCAQDTAVTRKENRRIATLRETASDFVLHGLHSLTYLRTKLEPVDTSHSGSGTPRAGTLNFKCLGVLVEFNEFTQLSDAVESQWLREADQPDFAQSESLPHPIVADCSQDVLCARASPTPAPDVLCGLPPLGCRMQLPHACRSDVSELRELLHHLAPLRTAHFPTTEATPPSSLSILPN